MPAVAAKLATLDDLMRVEGKAELINGEIIPMSPSGFLPGRVARRIASVLDDYADLNGGHVLGDNVGFAIEPLPSGRQSFSPDAAYYTGSLPANPMRFLPGPPTLAVEVRSENDDGPAAERAITAKRADYFSAGTLTIWDVDPLAKIVTTHRANGVSAVYSVGDIAEAEPACPGWCVAVVELFPAD